MNGFCTPASEADMEKGMIEYQKKPVTVMAKRLEHAIQIDTLEGTMQGNVGDYLVKGTEGEFYPVKPHIFEKCYGRTWKEHFAKTKQKKGKKKD